jgi:hypothetical protein
MVDKDIVAIARETTIVLVSDAGLARREFDVQALEIVCFFENTNISSIYKFFLGPLHN